jgi:hypothetical protein
MKECGYECASKAISKSENQQSEIMPFQIMRFNYDKELEEYRNLIIQLVSTSFNVNINHLRAYLKKIGNKQEQKPTLEKPTSGKPTKDKISKKYSIRKKGQQTKTSILAEGENSIPWDDEDAFLGAIQDIINTDNVIKDKYGREGSIV